MVTEEKETFTHQFTDGFTLHTCQLVEKFKLQSLCGIWRCLLLLNHHMTISQSSQLNSCCDSWTSAEVLVCIKTTWLLNVMVVLWSQSQWFAGFSQTDLCSRNKNELIIFLVLKWEQTLSDQIWWYNSLMLRTAVCTPCNAVSWNPALFPADMNTTTTVVFTSTQTHDHNKLLADLIGWLFSLSLSSCPILKPVTILLSQLHWGKQPLRRLEVHQEILDLCFDTNCI